MVKYHDVFIFIVMSNTISSSENLQNKASLTKASIRAEMAEKFLSEERTKKSNKAVENAQGLGKITQRVKQGVGSALSATKQKLFKGEVNKLINDTTYSPEFNKYVKDRTGDIESILVEIGDKNKIKQRELLGTISTATVLSSNEKQVLEKERIDKEKDKDTRKEVAKMEAFVQYLVEKGPLPKDFLSTVFTTLTSSKIDPKKVPTLTDIVRFTDMPTIDIQKIYFEKKYADIEKNSENILNDKLEIGKKEALYMNAYEMAYTASNSVKADGSVYKKKLEPLKGAINISKNVAKAGIYVGVGVLARTFTSPILFPISAALGGAVATHVLDSYVKSNNPKEVLKVVAKELVAQNIEPSINIGVNTTFNAHLQKLKEAIDNNTLYLSPEVIKNVIQKFPADKVEDLRPLAQVLHEILKKMEGKNQRFTSDYFTFQSIATMITDRQTNTKIQEMKSNLSAEVKNNTSSKEELFNFALDEKLKDLNELDESSLEYKKGRKKIFSVSAVGKGMLSKKFLMRLGVSAGAATAGYFYNNAIHGITDVGQGAQTTTESITRSVKNVGKTLSNIPSQISTGAHDVYAQGNQLAHNAVSGIANVPGQISHGIGYAYEQGTELATKAVHSVGSGIQGAYDYTKNLTWESAHKLPYFDYKNMDYFSSLQLPNALTGIPRDVVHGTLNLFGDFTNTELNLQKWWSIDLLWNNVTGNQYSKALLHSVESVFGKVVEGSEDTLRYLWQVVYGVYDDSLKPVMPEILDLSARIGALIGVVGGTHRYLIQRKSPIADVAHLANGGANALKGLLKRVEELRKKTGQALTSPTLKNIGTKGLKFAFLPWYVQIMGLRAAGKGIGSMKNRLKRNSGMQNMPTALPTSMPPMTALPPAPTPIAPSPRPVPVTPAPAVTTPHPVVPAPVVVPPATTTTVPTPPVTVTP